MGFLQGGKQHKWGECSTLTQSRLAAAESVLFSIRLIPCQCVQETDVSLQEETLSCLGLMNKASLLLVSEVLKYHSKDVPLILKSFMSTLLPTDSKRLS